MRKEKGDPCRGCVYYAEKSVIKTCDYLLITGHRRPCPAGTGCTAKKTAKEMEKDVGGRTRTWDAARAAELYDEGMDDAAIADAVGATESAVKNWRQKNGLRKQRGSKESGGRDALSVAADAAPPPPEGEARSGAADAATPQMGPTRKRSFRGERRSSGGNEVSPGGETERSTACDGAGGAKETEDKTSSVEVSRGDDGINADDLARLYINIGQLLGLAGQMPLAREQLTMIERDLVDLAGKLKREMWPEKELARC